MSSEGWMSGAYLKDISQKPVPAPQIAPSTNNSKADPAANNVGASNGDTYNGTETIQLVEEYEDPGKEFTVQNIWGILEKYFVEEKVTETEIGFNNAAKVLDDPNLLKTLYGVPYQFSADADPRLSAKASGNNGIYGRHYIKHIVGTMPIVIFVPGGPKYLNGADGKMKASLLKAMLSNDANASQNLLQKLTVRGDQRYYSFEADYTHYIDYVLSLAVGYRDWETDRKSTRLNSSHSAKSRMPSSA